MCGINGYNFSDTNLIKEMMRFTENRGPDASGIYSSEDITISHNRLSIIDLNERANQPMKYKHFIISYNGEIYNYKELKKNLEFRGHKFNTDSDTEVILHLFEQYNIESFKKLSGIFSIYLIINSLISTNPLFSLGSSLFYVRFLLFAIGLAYFLGKKSKKMSSKRAKKRVIKAFQLEGLTLSKGALNGVLSVLKSEEDEAGAIRVMIKSLKARIDRDETRSSVIDVDSISRVVADLSKDSEDMAKEGLQVFDAFEFPRLMWNSARKEFFLRNARGRLHENAKEKNQFLRDRFTLIRQRLMRNELFMEPAPGSIQRNYVELTAIESLRGSTGRKYILGMLSELEEGTYSIEDLNANIELDLTECTYHAGMYTLGSVVLVEGEIVDDKFRVSTMAFPPPEKREDTLRHMSNVKYLELAPGSQDYIHMRALEERAEDTMFVVLSNVHLDKPRVMEKLEEMFRVFSQSGSVPTAFVVTGNFMSRPFGHSYEDTKILTEHFDQLANMISKYSNIRKGSQFIFVRGVRVRSARISIIPLSRVSIT